MLAVLTCIGEGKKPTPGMAQQVHLGESESSSHCFNLGDGSGQGPHLRILRLFGASAAELVVEDDRPHFGEFCQALQIVAWHAGATVQAQQWGSWTGSVGAGPDLATRNIYPAFINL